MLVASGITKRFGDLAALDNVSAQFAPGEIHAVLGENGAGKSTLMSVLAGFTTPDAGSISLDGNEVPLGRPYLAKRNGIEMIHQHFTLVPEFTVAENLALAGLSGLAAVVRPGQVAARAFEAAKSLNWSVEPDARVRDLPVGVQQRIEILKAISADARVIILDEPTAVLTPDEVLDLFRVLRKLKEEGRLLILIAHKLSEVMQIADRVSVLRQGRIVGEAPITEVDTATLARWMVGELPAKETRQALSTGPVALTAANLRVTGDRGEAAVKSVSISIHGGEILGFGGVDGNGQVELAEALAGVRPIAAGELKGDVAGYVPQDGQTDGLALRMSIQDNVAVAAQRLRGLTSGPFLNLARIRDWTTELIQRFDIRVSGPEVPAGALSGGNQQKVVVSRVLSLQPGLLVVVNPTRGLDLRATAFVRQKLLEERARGAAIALFTTDLDELYELSDRVLFMSGGELVEPSGAAAYFGAKP